jgi:hypothetical protein
MAEMQIPLIKGDKVDDTTDYRDALPVNMSGVVKPILGAQGYMLQQPGLTEYGDVYTPPDMHDYVTFDGSTYLEKASDLTGIIDGKLGTYVTRIRKTTNSQRELLFNKITLTDNCIYIYYMPTGEFIITSSDTLGGAVLEAESDVAFTSLTEWLNVCLSWDAASAPQLYVNDTLISMTLTTWVDQAIDYTGTSWNVYGEGRPFYGDSNFTWFDSTDNMDFSVEANRRLFFDANGCPVDLGTTGEIPTGYSPILFVSGDSAEFITNKGTGGGFTLTGTLTDGSEACP